MNTNSAPNHNPQIDDVARKHRGCAPASPEESRRHWAAWYQAMELSHAMLLMRLQKEISPEGDLPAAYRQWHEQYQTTKWETNNAS